MTIALVWSRDGADGRLPGAASGQDLPQRSDDLGSTDPGSTKNTGEGSRTDVAALATGTVSFLDAATRDPVPDVRIGFADGDRRESRTTDPFGQVRLPVGEWAIESVSSPWSTQDRGLAVSPPPASTVHWLARTTGLSVLVEGAWGTPLVGAAVSWYGGSGEDDGVGGIPRPDRMARTDGRGIARFPGWRSEPGRIVASAPDHAMAVVPVRGPVRDDLLRVALRPVADGSAFSVSFVHRDGTPASRVRLDTSGGRTVECDEDGRLAVDQALLSELPLAVSGDQGYFPVRVNSLAAGQSVVLPRAIESRLVIVGGNDRLGFQIHRPWSPDNGDGFEIRPADWVVHERVTPLLVPADAPSSILAADAFGSHGRVDLPGSPTPEVVLRLEEGPRLRVRLRGRERLRSSDLRGEVHYQGEADESHLRIRPTADTLEVPRPGEAWQIRVFSGDFAVVKLGRPAPEPVDDEAVAGEVSVALEPPSTSTVRVATRDGQPVAGVVVQIDSQMEITVPWPEELLTGHPAWVRFPPDRRELVSDGKGKAVVAAISGPYEVSLKLPMEYSGSWGSHLYREASRTVRLPSARVIEFTVPSIVFREIRVRERWSGLPVTGFEIRGPGNGWTIRVEGSLWQGRTHDEELTITVPGLGSTTLGAGSPSHAVVQVAAEAPCQVRFLGWSAADVRWLQLTTLKPGTGGSSTRPIERDLVRDGRLPIHLPPGSRFRIRVITSNGTFRTPVFDWRAGAVYEFPLDRD